MRKAQYAELIERHYSEIWSSPIDSIRLQQGPIAQLPEDFSVLVIRRTPEVVAYATKCMSQLSDENRLELHLLASAKRAPDFGAAEILTAAAHYHRTGAPLGLGHTVNFGRPWFPESSCDHGLVSLPYLDGPGLELIEDPAVRFLWLVPITSSELRFKKDRGLEALEQRFEEAQFDYLDPFRPSVV